VLRESKLILWDEAPMAPKYALDALDLLLRDIMQCDRPFGGKVVVLGGDFRQVLPVVRHASRAQLIQVDSSK
jgi:ATP-dependent DNA helicase PIF1